MLVQKFVSQREGCILKRLKALCCKIMFRIVWEELTSKQTVQ